MFPYSFSFQLYELFKSKSGYFLGLTYVAAPTPPQETDCYKLPQNLGDPCISMSR